MCEQVGYRSRERFLLYFGKCNLAFMYVSGRDTEVEEIYAKTSVNVFLFYGVRPGGVRRRNNIMGRVGKRVVNNPNG